MGTFDITDPIMRVAPTRIIKNHPIEIVIGELIESRKTRDKPGLKQAPRAWYESLTKKFVEKSYKRVGVNKTLFVKSVKSGITIAQIYVDIIV